MFIVVEEIATAFSIEDAPGHISYILIAISYWLTDIYWLRVTAVIGTFLEIVYFSMSGGDLRTGIAWDCVFIAINIYQLHQLVKDQRKFRLPQDNRELLRSVMTGLSDAQIARVLAAGTFQDIPVGTKLTTEHEALSKLYFICAGLVHVSIAGRPVSKLGAGTFIGEIAFLTGQSATATVTTQRPVRAIVFNADHLAALFKNESEVAGIVYQLLGRQLAEKMKVSNSLISATAVEA